MFKRFKKNATSGTPSAEKTLSDGGQITYAIGDVHGCKAEMISLLEKIEADAAEFSGKKVVIVFLGDLMDRGPDSRGVIEHLLAYTPDFAELVYIKGNHEEIFLKVLKGSRSSLEGWFQHGGKDCARSYGVKNFGRILMNPEGLLHEIQRAVPKAHQAFLEGFQDYYQFGDYLCVHAGIRPGKKLAKQEARDMRWIRGAFLDSKKQHEFKVIHGHTVVQTPENLSNRIAVDTGAYKGQSLTAVRIGGGSETFLQSGAESAEE